MRAGFTIVLIQLLIGKELLGAERDVFSYAEVSISRRLEGSPQPREVTEAEAVTSKLLAGLRKAKASIVTDEVNAIVAIHFIELDSEALSEEAIQDVRKLASLRCISIRAPQLIRQLLPEVCLLPMLEELNLCTWQLSSEMIESLNRAPRLCSLGLEATRIDDEAVAAIAKLRQLKILHLDDCRYPRGIEAAFVPMPHLKTLWLHGGGPDTAVELKGVEFLSDLQCLRISGIWCSREALERIGKLNQLEELSLQFVGLNDEMLGKLDTLTKMRRAIFGNETDFTGDGLRHLAAWRNLEELSVFATSFEDNGAKNLSQFQELRKFSAHDTFLTDASIDAMVKMQKLKLAWVSKTKITPTGMDRLRKELPECHVR